MGDRNFMDMLRAKWAQGRFVCVGLDSDHSKIPVCVKQGTFFRTVVTFNRGIIDATHDLVCAFKPNIAFYEARGSEGIDALIETVGWVQRFAPDVPVILDGKRADIGDTNNGYVEAAFEVCGADAVTVNPYFGQEALQPFLSRKDKGIIVLCRTSNPGARELQGLLVTICKDERERLGEAVWFDHGIALTTLSNHVAHQISQQWNGNGNCGIVVGATSPEDLRMIRGIVGEMPILIPGIGFQQKDVSFEDQVKQVVSAGISENGAGMIINASRSIIFASNGPDFAEAARRETERLHKEIQKNL